MLSVSDPEKVWVLRSFFKHCKNTDCRTVLALAPHGATLSAQNLGPTSNAVLTLNKSYFDEYRPLDLAAITFVPDSLSSLLQTIKSSILQLELKVNSAEGLVEIRAGCGLAQISTSTGFHPAARFVPGIVCRTIATFEDSVAAQLKAFRGFEIRLELSLEAFTFSGYKLDKKIVDLLLEAEGPKVRVQQKVTQCKEYTMGQEQSLYAVTMSAKLGRPLQLRLTRGEQFDTVEWGVEDRWLQLTEGRKKIVHAEEDKAELKRPRTQLKCEEDEAYQIIRKRINRNLSL